MKCIDILVGDTPYGSTAHFSKELSRSLEKLEVKTRLLSLDESNYLVVIQTMKKDPPDLTCSFSDISMNGTPLGELWSIPHLSMMVDPPIYFLYQLTSQYSRVSCVDQKDVAFVKALGFDKVFYLPHGVEKELLTAVERERPYDVVFFGSCIDYEALPFEMESAASRVLSPDGVSILEALVEERVLDEELPRCHHELDRYIRGKDRVELINRFDHVHIWGEGPWEKYCPQATVHPALPFGEMIGILKQSKVVLNSSPRFKDGLHERILYATLCGCAVITGKNPAIWDELYTYEHGVWEIPDFSDLQTRVEASQKIILREHTWDSRAQQLLASIK